MRQPSPLYKRYRFPGGLISHAVLLYVRFLLGYRDVEELLAERGIAVSYETVRRWCRRFGATYAEGVRRRRPRPGDKWHLDELVLKSNGQRHYLWRAVDQEGMVLDTLVQPRRNPAAAAACRRRRRDVQQDEPRVAITDTLASYAPARRRVLPRTEHRRHRGLNNRAEDSHRPTRRRARARSSASSRQSTRGRSSGPSARSLATPARAGTVSPPRRMEYHHLLQTRFATWRAVTGLAAAQLSTGWCRHASARRPSLPARLT